MRSETEPLCAARDACRLGVTVTPPNTRLQPTAYRAARQGSWSSEVTCPPSFVLFGAAGQPCSREVIASRVSSLLAQHVGG